MELRPKVWLVICECESVLTTFFQDLGIALNVVGKDDVMPKSLELAEQIASASPVAVQATLRTLRSQIDEGLFRALQREADSQAHCYAHRDLKEGLSSVREKRNPKF